MIRHPALSLGLAVVAWLERVHVGWYRASLVAAFLSYYLSSYFGYYALPGTPTAPEGWFRWHDQGAYLRSARALHDFDLGPALHLYPFGYALLGAPFARLLPNHPFLPANVALSVVSVLVLLEIYREFMTKLEAAALLLATFVFQYAIVEHLVIPLNTIPTMACAHAASLLLLRGATGIRHAVLAGGLAGFTFLVRPADTLFMVPLLAGLLVTGRGGTPRHRFVLAAAASGAVFASVLLGLNLTVFGRLTSPYTDAVRHVGFSVENVGVKLYSAFFGARALYLVDGPMLFERFPWLFLALPGLLGSVVVCRARRGWLVANAIAVGVCFVFYAAYNDFDPVNLFQYHTFHYVAWSLPLLTLFAYFGLRRLLAIAVRPAAVAAMAAALVLLFAVHLRFAHRAARLEAAEGSLGRLAACAARQGAERAVPCGVELRIAVPRCANVIDLVGITALEHASLFVVDAGGQRGEPEAFRRVADRDRTRIILHRTVCRRDVVVAVRAVDGIAPSPVARAYRASLAYVPWGR